MKSKFSLFNSILLISGIAFATGCAQNVLPDDPFSEPAAGSTELSSNTQPPVGLTTPTDDKALDIDRILSAYPKVDPTHKIPSNLLAKALDYYDSNASRISNRNYLSVIDFSAKSTKPRLFIINMKSGDVWALHMAHGKGSDSNHDGFAEKFSNAGGSNASSLGFYLTAETYSGNHGLSLRLDGLSSTNSNARDRAVVIHGADYVADSAVIQGRSWGCPAVSMNNRTEVINRLKGGSLIYAGLSGK